MVFGRLKSTLQKTYKSVQLVSQIGINYCYLTAMKERGPVLSDGAFSFLALTLQATTSLGRRCCFDLAGGFFLPFTA